MQYKLYQTIAELSLCTTWHITDMLHMINTQFAARDLHTIVPGPLQRTCWRRLTAQWGGCKKSWIATEWDYHYYYYFTILSTKRRPLQWPAGKTSVARAEDQGLLLTIATAAVITTTSITTVTSTITTATTTISITTSITTTAAAAATTITITTIITTSTTTTAGAATSATAADALSLSLFLSLVSLFLSPSFSRVWMCTLKVTHMHAHTHTLTHTHTRMHTHTHAL